MIIAARAREAVARRRSRSRARRRSATGSTCRASSPTARRPTRARASCSSSRATRPAARPSRAAIARRRRSCRSRGKVLNAEQASGQKVLDNKELAGHRQRPRLRHGREVRPRQAALRQDHPADGRRHRRPPHRDAAADVLLPPHAAADRQRATSTSRSRRSTASTSARRRTGRSTTSHKERLLKAHAKATPSRTSPGSRASAR